MTRFGRINAAMLMAVLAVASTVASAESKPPAAVTLDCKASLGSEIQRWRVELDDSLPLAMVDESDTPADYTSSHVRVRLGVSAPALFIGRVSGRLVVAAADGRTLGVGRCSAGIST